MGNCPALAVPGQGTACQLGQARKGAQLVGASRSFPHCFGGNRVPLFSGLDQNNGSGRILSTSSSDIDERPLES